MATQVSLTGTSVKTPRKSYSREFKLQVIKFYRDPQNTLYATSKHFSVDKKCILRWAHEETKIKKSSKGSKHCRHAKGGTYEKMEEVLVKEFLDLREKGLRVRGYWFKVRAKQLMEEMEPETKFAASDGWFTRFKARHSVSLRRPTNASQKAAGDKEGCIQAFHHQLRKLAAPADGEEVRDVGRFCLHQIANMDQTPLPFCFTDGTTYDQTGAQTVWVRGAASGLDKRQCTVQLTIFADGVARVKPLIIFRGKGARITFLEKVHTVSYLNSVAKQ